MTTMTDSLGNPSDDDAAGDVMSRTIELGAMAELLDVAGVAAAVLTRDARVRHTNAAFGRACGRPPRELEAHALTSWAMEEDAPLLWAVISKVADDATAQPAHSTDARIVGADGRVRPLRLHLGLLPDSQGELLVCIAHDRSEDRRRDRGDRSMRVAEAAAANTDAETGVLNRSGLETALASASRRSRNNHSPHALIRCELRLDEPGETAEGSEGPGVDAGHGSVGPEALQACIERIRQRLRPADTVARLEQSALAVVAEDLNDEQDAAGVAYRLLSTVVEPVPGSTGPVALRMVIGLAMADATTPPNALIAAAAEAAADARGPGGFAIMDLRNSQVED